jgi:hypothetical protein
MSFIYLFEKKTKWKILAGYNYLGNDFLVLGRKGLKTGMIHFKVKKVNGYSSLSYFFRNELEESIEERLKALAAAKE